MQRRKKTSGPLELEPWNGWHNAVDIKANILEWLDDEN